MAAMMILLIWPENIVNPSFQMSFLAVFAIIICHKYLSGKSFLTGVPSLVKYFILLCITSLVASIATGLIIALSFNNFSPYSILANFIAVPLTSFYLMPLVVIFFIAQIFSLETFILILMKPAIEIIINSAKFVTTLPLSKIEIAQLNSISVYSFVVMIIIYFSNHSKAIKYSALALSILILPFVKAEKPLLVSKKDLAIALIDTKLYSYPKKIPSWSKKNYLAFYGKKEIFFTDTIAKNIDNNLPENTNMLIYKNNKKVLFCSDCKRPWR
jgi:competence protein ComEC